MVICQNRRQAFHYGEAANEQNQEKPAEEDPTIEIRHGTHTHAERERDQFDEAPGADLRVFGDDVKTCIQTKNHESESVDHQIVQCA